LATKGHLAQLRGLGRSFGGFRLQVGARCYLFVEGKLVKREYERESQAGKSSVKVPALAAEVRESKIVKLARPAQA
jgi:hypothetical protein